MLNKRIVSTIGDPRAFLQILENNPGLVIVKFGANWCAPCMRIKPSVDGFFASSPDSVVCCDIDIDKCYELYSYLKNKRMVRGVPSILCYRRGNTQVIPDDSVSGSDLAALDSFFHRCGNYSEASSPSKSHSPIRSHA
jgi:thiol-disulfide isomerase/thioredoxin